MAFSMFFYLTGYSRILRYSVGCFTLDSEEGLRSTKSVTPFLCVKVKTSTPRNWTTTTKTYINIIYSNKIKYLFNKNLIFINISFKRLSRLSAFHSCTEHYTFLFENSRYYFQFSEPLFPRNIFPGVMLGTVMLGTDSQKQAYLCRIESRHNYACFSEKRA